jgi:Flp pilus assembly pilin Flp
MFTQNPSFKYALIATVVVAMIATVALLTRALHGFQVFW